MALRPVVPDDLAHLKLLHPANEPFPQKQNYAHGGEGGIDRSECYVSEDIEERPIGM
jgi:hypothetical protein